MKKSKEELTRIHKEKCRELKEIRARMAEDLGIELHQRECTYDGYCSGTCPACRKEELQINAALLKKQLEETNLKGRIAAAGLTTMAALCLTGCNTSEQQTEGDILPETYEDMTEGVPKDMEGEPYEYMEEGDILPDNSEDPAQSSCETPESYEDMWEGEMPDTSEDPAQSSYEIPETYEYTDLEGDFAIPETAEPQAVD